MTRGRKPRANQKPSGSSSLSYQRPSLAGVQLGGPAPLRGAWRSSWTPDRATARNPAPARKTRRTVATQPDDHGQVTGPGQHALLTKGTPMGASTSLAGVGFEPT